MICKSNTHLWSWEYIACFILTMWYVNKDKWMSNMDDALEFYINYVICKCYPTRFIRPSWNSFILTMWYVNQEKVFNGTSDFVGFILTMWYVNQEIILW